MPEFKQGEAAFLKGCAEAFAEAFERDVAALLRAELRGVEPASEEPLAKVVDGDLAKALRRRIAPYEELLKADWLVGVAPARVPRVTDFLSIRCAEEAASSAPALAPRVYDEKFHKP